ncbi:MAG: 4-hydroxy-tetrahydrodipicolinate reductase [Clostridia bacterium]|jgi:4-hydroxy-tetrahydrodipicolinate reductase|nr:4-hydroxy-tetrahydrodipicolinate reductase [Clostridia bacterium]MCI1998964.1 4-hydroxy-tetrahydrodipicolinate reductase [Clostridia bacterium]MCI2013714.1 4-hydroxy-tetrahydrodipicolinate reductase [Clostridia bacterium]
MINIIIHGCGGKMGKVVEGIINRDENCSVAAGIDPRDSLKADYPVFKNIADCTVKADVIIDFSTASAIPALLEYCKNTKTPAILCTTGFSDELNTKVKETSASVALLKSANMSVGINLIMNLVKKAADVLYDSGFDIEILEKHHNQKIDAPSGTAIAIADSINEALGNKLNYVYDRSQVREKRTHDQVGISSIRGGTIVGEHDVIFAGQDEIITISHTAMSKEIFAVGAVKAAKYLAGKPAGFYTMKDVLE